MPTPEIRGLCTGPFAQNVFLAWCPRTREGVVIDPGFEPERVLALARKEGVRVREVLATHGHIDHVWGAAAVAAATGAPFRMHPADDYWLAGLDRQAAMFGLDAPERAPSNDRPLEEGETIAFGDVSLRVISTPGHSPGSVCFHDGGTVLFGGDLLFQGSIGRTDFPGGDFPTIVRSIRRRVFTLAPETVVHTGHGPETTVGEEKAGNPFVGDGAGEEGFDGGYPGM